MKEIWASPQFLEWTRKGLEFWRPVVGTDCWYFISNLGEVRTWRRRGVKKQTVWATKPTLLKPSRITGGYLAVTLTIGGKKVCKVVSALMAEAFIGPRPGSYRFWQAGHVDDDKTNNVLTNIRWVTAMQNTDDRRRNGGRTKPARATRTIGTVLHYRCTRCDKWKPKDEFGRLTGKNARTSECGIQSNCRKCANAYRNELRRRKANVK